MKVLITGHKGQIGSVLAQKIKHVGIDLIDGQNLLTCNLPKNIDIVFHLAAQSSVEPSWHDPLHDLDNIRITARIVKEYPKAKIIYTSSCATINPVSPYGFSKWASGEYIKKFHDNYVICVLPNVFGVRKSVVDIFSKTDTVTIYGDGKNIRSYVHVNDIVDGLIKAIDWKKGEYFMGGTNKTVLQLAKGKNIKYKPARREAKSGVIPNTTPNWKPTITL